MRSGTRWALAAGVLALAVGLAVALSHGPPSPPASQPPSARLSTGLRVPAPAPAPRPAGSLRIRGVMLGDSGPAAGVRVTATRPEPGQTLSELSCAEVLGQPDRSGQLPSCWWEAGTTVAELVGARLGELPVHAEATTAADGGFTLEGLSEGRFTLWAVTAHGAVMQLEVPAGTEGLELVLGSGVTLEGRVTDSAGNPLTDVQVTALYPEHPRFFEARTGAGGRFRLGPLPAANDRAAEDYRVVFIKEGWLPELTPASTVEQVRLHRPLRLTGRVLRDGVPAPGAEVRLEDLKPPLTAPSVTRAEAEGRFTFEPLRPRAYKLTAALDGKHAILLVELDAGGPPPEVVLELGTALFVEGMVQDSARNPVAGAVVAVDPRNRRTAMLKATTGAEGRYRVGPLQPGEYDLGVSAPRYRDVEHYVLELGPDTGPVDFTLAPMLRLEGVAVDEEGRPAPGVPLELLRPDEEVPHGADATFSTDEAGRFGVDARAPGTWHVKVRPFPRTGFAREPHEVQAPGTEVRLVLRRGASISGTVTTEQGAPVPRTEVVLWLADAEGEAVETAHTDAQGRFSLTGLEPGRYVVEATEASGGVERSTAWPVELRAREAVEVSLRLEDGWTLSGLVVDGAGQPVPGARVYPSRPALPPWRKDSEKESSPFVRTGPEGRFTLRNLQDSVVELNAFQEGYRFAPSRSVGGQPRLKHFQVREGAGDVRLVLERQGHIRGRVAGPSGEPITRFLLNTEEVVDPRGAFSLPFDGSGPVSLDFSAKGMALALRVVETREGTDVDLGEVRLAPGRRVAGRVLDAKTSAPVWGASVVAASARIPGLDLDDHPVSARTDRAGAFVLPQVESQPLTLFVEARGYPPHRVGLGAGDQEDLTVRLERGAEVVLSVVDARGKPLEDVIDVSFHQEGSPLASRGVRVTDGEGVVSGLEPGSYEVRAHTRPRRAGTPIFPLQRVQVPASGQLAVTLVAQDKGATLVLRVKGDGPWQATLLQGSVSIPRRFEDLRLMLTRGLPSEQEQPGTVTFRNVPPGRATLFLEEGEYEEGVVKGIHREELSLPAEGTLRHEVTPDWRIHPFSWR